MKQIYSTQLDKHLFMDRFKKVPATLEEKGAHLTGRIYLQFIVDAPIPPRTPLTRAISKTIDRIYDALGKGDLVLENADYEYLVSRVADISINSKFLYDSVQDILDSALDYITSPTVQ